MRRLLALGCCALYLVFGFMAGTAHSHESVDHHAEARGLHLDHMHLGEADHDHYGGGDHDGDAQLDAQYSGHHHGEALYLNTTASRSFNSSPRVIPAAVFVSATIDSPASVSNRDETKQRLPRDPPSKSRTRPRAPPA